VQQDAKIQYSKEGITLESRNYSLLMHQIENKFVGQDSNRNPKTTAIYAYRFNSPDNARIEEGLIFIVFLAFSLKPTAQIRKKSLKIGIFGHILEGPIS
jgi:hypothetical protein